MTRGQWSALIVLLVACGLLAVLVLLGGAGGNLGLCTQTMTPDLAELCRPE